MLRNEKEAVIAEVAQLLADSENLFVSDYRGLTVGAAHRAARQAARERRHLQGRQEHPGRHRRRPRPGRDGVKELLSGPTAVTFCGDDPVAAAKALADFARTHPQLEVRGGLLDTSLIDASRRQGAGDAAAARRARRSGRRHHGRTHDRTGHGAPRHDQSASCARSIRWPSSGPPPARPESPPAPTLYSKAFKPYGEVK